MRPAHGNARYPPALLRLIMQAGFRWLGLSTYEGLEHINHFVRICQYFLSNTPGALTGADRIGDGKLKNRPPCLLPDRSSLTGAANGVPVTASTENSGIRKKLIPM